MTDTRSTIPLKTHPDELIQQLRQTGETLPEQLRNDLLAVGSSIVPALIELVEANLEDPDTNGWSAVNAAQLLGELKDMEAIPILLDCVEKCDPLDLLHDKAIKALVQLGDAVIEPGIERYRTTKNDELRDGVAGILQRLGIRDEKIYEILVETLHRTPALGANYLADYGDPRALPSLLAKFDELTPAKTDNPFENHVFIELKCAIRDLGGHLNEAQERKFEQADETRRQFAEKLDAVFAPPPSPTPAEPVRKKHKLGRNDPCWCGSGKKYKKCHLPLER